jgi:hypothetical protein
MLSYDAQLLLLGAGIALISSLITIFVKDWVSARRRRIERKEEKKRRTRQDNKRNHAVFTVKRYADKPGGFNSEVQQDAQRIPQRVF